MVKKYTNIHMFQYFFPSLNDDTKTENYYFVCTFHVCLRIFEMNRKPLSLAPVTSNMTKWIWIYVREKGRYKTILLLLPHFLLLLSRFLFYKHFLLLLSRFLLLLSRFLFNKHFLLLLSHFLVLLSRFLFANVFCYFCNVFYSWFPQEQEQQQQSLF